MPRASCVSIWCHLLSKRYDGAQILRELQEVMIAQQARYITCACERRLLALVSPQVIVVNGAFFMRFSPELLELQDVQSIFSRCKLSG